MSIAGRLDEAVASVIVPPCHAQHEFLGSYCLARLNGKPHTAMAHFIYARSALYLAILSLAARFSWGSDSIAIIELYFC